MRHLLLAALVASAVSTPAPAAYFSGDMLLNICGNPTEAVPAHCTAMMFGMLYGIESQTKKDWCFPVEEMAVVGGTETLAFNLRAYLFDHFTQRRQPAADLVHDAARTIYPC